YDTGAANAGTITSPSIALAAGGPISLSFNYVLLTEAGFDQATVQVSNNGGASFTTIASSTGGTLPQSGSWRAISFDLSSYAGQTIQLRFSFDTIDSIANAFEGWYVDDVQLTTPGTWNDYYSMNLSAGDRVTVGLKNTTGAGTTLSLLNPSGTPLA